MCYSQTTESSESNNTNSHKKQERPASSLATSQPYRVEDVEPISPPSKLRMYCYCYRPSAHGLLADGLP